MGNDHQWYRHNQQKTRNRLSWTLVDGLPCAWHSEGHTHESLRLVTAKMTAKPADIGGLRRTMADGPCLRPNCGGR
jgi:hypothetical protein